MSGSSFSKTTKLPPTAIKKPWSAPALRFDDTFTRELPGDAAVPTAPYEMMSSDGEIPVPQARFRMSRIVRGALWSWAVPAEQENPRLVGVSAPGAQLLGLSANDFWCDPQAAAAVWSGNQRLPGSNPWAHCYGGHQFGVWADQLGDGRAISLGQATSAEGNASWEVQLKGAGRTPYSRFADGYAVRRSSIREYLAAEHMSALGVPTSRSLALVFTDRVVEREEAELGAVVTRLAPSWVRFGSFELPASRSDYNLLRELADYVIRHHYPELRRLPSQDNVYVRLLKCVVERTAAMVAAWQAVGFCHGVMNTDNMSILGLTIDYGPFAFLDAYDPDFICNHSDPTGRYAFREQPRVALWNLVRLAGPLSRLAGSAPEADASSEILDAVAQTLNSFGSEFSRNYTDIMHLKFGLAAEYDDNGNDMAKVVQPFLDLLERGRTDYTFAMRALCDVPLLLNDDSDEPLLKCHIDALAERSDCNSMGDDWQGAVRAFYKDVYGPRLAAQGVVDQQSAKSLSASMRLANPRHVLRNWVAQDIIEQAEKESNVACVDQALELLTTFAFSDTLPEHLREMAERYAGPVPQWGEGLQCSCSS